MKSFLIPFSFLALSVVSFAAEKKEEDEVEIGLRQVYATYKAGDDQEVLAQLRALAKLE